MASLIGPLTSGIIGGESGAAYIYERDTTTDASVYSDSDGQTAVTAHALDPNGSVVRYVRSSVDVVVQDSGGTVVREFTWEVAAESVEVTNDGFTGSMPDGSTAAGGRVSLDAILSLLYVSLGAEDGKVLVNGAGQYIKDVIGSTTGIFFNVTASSYGATGDGSTDDKAACQAAINAASAAGGGIVYFPPGTYILSSGLTIPGDVHLLGTSADCCILKSQASTTSTTGIATVTGAHSTVQNLAFENGTSAAMFPFAVTATGARFIGCKFPGTVTNHSTIAASCIATFIDCHFTVTAATSSIATVTGTFSMVGGFMTFTGLATSTGLFTGNGSHILNGVTVTDAHSAGAIVMFTGATSTVTLTGCVFTTSSGGTLQVIGAASIFSESGCSFPTFSTTSLFLLPSASGAFPTTTHSTTRNSRATSTSGSATSYQADAGIAKIHRVTTTGASFQFTAPLPASGVSNGTELVLYYKNSNAGAVTPSVVAAFKTTTMPSVASGSAICLHVTWDSTNSLWLQVGAIAVYAS